MIVEYKKTDFDPIKLVGEHGAEYASVSSPVFLFGMIAFRKNV